MPRWAITRGEGAGHRHWWSVDTQSFTVKVDDVNERQYHFDNGHRATQDQPYSYDVDATDPDAGDTLTFALDTAPLA